MCFQVIDHLAHFVVIYERSVYALDAATGKYDFSMDLGMGAQLYRKEARSLQFQIQATNIADRLNVINFASIFSGTAIGVPRSVSARLRVSF